MVHVAVDGSILVVGVLLDLDAELFPPRNSSPLVARLWEAGVDYNATRVEAAEQPLNPCESPHRTYTS